MMRRQGLMSLPPLLVFLSCLSCTNLVVPRERGMVLCPGGIAREAESYARNYSGMRTEYLWGGQDRPDPSGRIRIDCSGLAVNCYRYATRGSGYDLPFADASVRDFHERYSVRISRPRAGDIVFMGAPRSRPTHMAIFVRQDRHSIWFVDSTFNEEKQIDGVSLRSYPRNDPRFLGFGRVLLRHGY